MHFYLSIICGMNSLCCHFVIYVVTPPSISFQILSDVRDCSRLTPVPVNVTWCPRLFSRVDFQCTIDIPRQTPLITFNGTPFTASYIESFTTSNNGMYRCSFQNSCGSSTEVKFVYKHFVSTHFVMFGMCVLIVISLQGQLEWTLLLIYHWEHGQ